MMRVWMCGAAALLLWLGGPPADAAPLPGAACATAHPLATQACVDVLADGGNAFDAAVAASAALAVVEPTGSGLGGGGFWLLHRASVGEDVFVDGREEAPAGASRDMYLGPDGKAIANLSRFGPLAAGIPGEPAALDHISSRYGVKPLAEVLAPAIRYAAEGFEVDDDLASAISRFAPAMSPAARSIYVPGGEPLKAGATLRQPDLAVTLGLLAERGRDGFYRGELAQRLVDGVRAEGGLWTLADLAHYEVVEREPTVSWYRDYRIVSAPPPSAGGLGLAQVLQQLEILGRTPDAANADHLLVEAFRRAYRDRAAYLGDPDVVSVPLAHLASRSYVMSLAASIDPERATPSSSLPPAVPTGEGTDTTHLSVIDAQGNRVAATLSINLPFGSSFMVAGTGVFLNDEMDDFGSAPGEPNAYGLVGSEANAVAPGKRPLSSMTPTFVEGPRGVLMIGTPGGSRIITMVIQGVLAWIDGASLSAIVSQPRLHHQYLPDVVQIEPDLPAAVREDLEARGHVLREVGRRWGDMQAVAWYPQQRLLDAASDPRGIGQALAVPVRPVP